MTVYTQISQNNWPSSKNQNDDYLILNCPFNQKLGLVDIGVSAGSKVIRSPRTISILGNTSITSTQSKYYGSSAYFDGSGDYLSLSGSDFGFSSGVAFTVEGWLYANSLPSAGDGSGAAIFGNREYIQSNSFTAYLGSSSTNTVGIHVGGSVLGYFNVSGGLSINTWHHFALTRNTSNQLNFYVNGTVASNTLTQSDLSNAAFYVGCWGSGRGAFFNGYMQDFRLSLGVAKYTSNFTPPGPILGSA